MIGVQPYISGRRSMTATEAQTFLTAIKADERPSAFVRGLIVEANQVLQTGEYWIKELP